MNEQLTKKTFTVPENDILAALAGIADDNFKMIESEFGVLISTDGPEVAVKGDPDDVDGAMLVLEGVLDGISRGSSPDRDSLRLEIEQSRRPGFTPKGLADKIVLMNRKGPIRPKTSGQRDYIECIESSTVTFGIGPAGTGKTYLAMACALAAIKNREVGRIVLSRPIIEAGESLGYLPGTLTEKVDPYIRPLYDALFDLTDRLYAEALMKDGLIEIVPLAFMRGRTLNDSFIILDEAQNTTPEQMKMFLTRLGNGSKMAITGDLTQSDLPKGAKGLNQALRVLSEVEGISICRLSSRDVVRNPIVSAIIAAYENEGER